MARRKNRTQSIDSTMQEYEQDRRDPFRTMQEIADQIDYQEQNDIIPDYLDPIGQTGFFITPNEPADPTDCERYPNSPYCGGTGIDFDSILDLTPISVEPSVSFNECEVCIQVDASLFWISLAPGLFCYRSKDAACYRDPDPDPPPPPPPGVPGAPPGTFTPIGSIMPPGSNCRVIVEHRAMREGRDVNGAISCFNDMEWQQATIPLGSPLGYYTSYASETENMVQFVGIYRAGQPARVAGNPMFVSNFCGGYQFRQRVEDPNCTNTLTPTTSRPPPYIPPDDCTGCMSCCGSNKENQEILDMLRRLSRRLGTADYPISTPRWLVSNQGGGTVKHESLTQFNFWLMRQLDALIGEFPIRVEIEDADPTQEGQQSKTVTLPNLAEAVAEIYGLAAKTSVDSDMHTSFLMRLAAEVMATKTAALIAQDYASGNASYLGYRGNSVERKVNFAFDPNKLDSIETILKASQQTIVGWQNDDKENVAAYLQKLMFSAGLIKTVFFRKGKDLQRILAEVSQFMPDPKAEDSAEWKEFLRLINDPESLENKGTDLKPEIKNLGRKSRGEG